jgi:hypothetical protein
MIICRCFLTAVLLTTIAFGQSTWTVGPSNVAGVSALYSVAYGNGRFVATAGDQFVAAIWSSDGLTWQRSSLASPVQGSVVFIDGTFYLAGSNYVRSSKDGVTWQDLYTAAGNVAFRSAATDGKTMMISSGLQTAATPFYSSDLITWRPTSPLPDPTGTGTVSTQGTVYYVAGRYYIGYTVRQPNFNERSFAASTADGGATWRQETQLSLLFVVGSIAAGNGKIIAFQGPNASVSTDGSTFAPLTLPFSPFGAQLFFVGGRFVAVSESVRVSIDGTSWTTLPPFGTSVGVFSWAYGKGRLVGVGYVTLSTFPNFTTRDTISSLLLQAPPIVTLQPASLTIAEGTPAAFSLELDNPDLGTTFQWRRNGTAVPGATTSTFAIGAVTLGDAGSYVCDIRNAQGSTITAAATLTVRPASEAGRIVNLSVLSRLEGGDDSMTVGFVVGGAGTTGTKALLLRAGGPSLSRFGVSAPNPDPKLELVSAGVRVAENDNWGGSAQLSDAIAQVGAFNFLTADSKDAAFFSGSTARGDNSVKISATGGASGAVIAEIYDATPTAAFTASTPRLVNVSVLKNLPAGGSLSAGFVIAGLTPRTVLIRAIGPGLSAFNVGGFLADPQLQLYQSGALSPIATNNDWSGTAVLQSAFTSVGAFSLIGSSRDAALLMTLPPGNYSAQVSGAPNTTGMVLVEVYEVN